ncbi:hypothetical protein V6N12_074885 [Hibiscus sabdariffa]|uniref:Uncharacterized protein n=1 Tax=Hibiscus sabdariffa TaxID=183260 RepID=A0ABR2D2R4_9ROSI
MTRNDFGVWEIFLPNNQKGSLRITHVSRVKIRKDTPSPLGSKTRFQLGLSSLYRLLAKFHIREYTTIHQKRVPSKNLIPLALAFLPPLQLALPPMQSQLSH